MVLGFIGTGTIAAAMVDGLRGGDILVSPRGTAVPAELSARHEGVRVADGNQSVVDGSDTVVLSVRPQVAEEIVRDLRFRRDQRVVSLIAATGSTACAGGSDRTLRSSRRSSGPSSPRETA
ncbi:NAD(P)-binding domain-containing protein [Aureimonas sp. ME7]|uniref:NAD(P)-binding domain-containing protein n=1 Tax=Aureimonas sp. ME7 TaxID=2744252 RepID=UPI0015F7691B|nr:NAD(P)-binding domain-containing protein [Aureimonas sp. ME7]